MLYNSIIGKKGWRNMEKTSKKKMEDGYKSIEELDMYMLYYGDAVVYQGGTKDLVKKLHQHRKHHDKWGSIYRLYCGNTVVYQGEPKDLVKKLHQHGKSHGL